MRLGRFLDETPPWVLGIVIGGLLGVTVGVVAGFSQADSILGFLGAVCGSGLFGAVLGVRLARLASDGD